MISSKQQESPVGNLPASARSHLSDDSLSTLSILRALKLHLRRLIRFVIAPNRRLILEAILHQNRPLSQCNPGETLIVIRSDNYVAELNADLYHFLGGREAEAELDGVRKGDWLYVVRGPDGYWARTYVFFGSNAQTIRQQKILCETGTPVFGMSFVTPHMRGKGLYQKLINMVLADLQHAGYKRAVCEIEPHNIPSIRASKAVGMTVRRELSDWIVFRHLLVQRITEGHHSRWRVTWV